MPASANIKSPAYYGFGSAHYVTNNMPGAIFYVDNAGNGGDDANDGLSPNTPFLTITYALTQCTAWKNDYLCLAGNSGV